MPGAPREGQLMCKLFLSMRQASESSLKELLAGICNSTVPSSRAMPQDSATSPSELPVPQDNPTSTPSGGILITNCKLNARVQQRNVHSIYLDAVLIRGALTSIPQKLLPLLLLLDIDGRQRLSHKVLSCDGRIAPLLASNDSALVGLRAQHTSSESNTSTLKKSQPIN